MEERITLDKKAFKALSSDSRVRILKSLGRRRKMLSELSTEFGMSPSTMKEHMDSLLDAGLVDKKDDGHKWKYYELTRAGKNVVFPGETRIWVVIGISALAMVFTGYGLIGGFSEGTPSQGFLKDAATAGTNEIAPAAAAAMPSAGMSAEAYAAGFIIFALILGICFGYIAARGRLVRQ